MADDEGEAIATSLMRGEAGDPVGQRRGSASAGAQIRAWAQWIGKATGATVGVLTDGANAWAGYLGARAARSRGLNAERNDRAATQGVRAVEPRARATMTWEIRRQLAKRCDSGHRDRVFGLPQRCARLRRT